MDKYSISEERLEPEITLLLTCKETHKKMYLFELKQIIQDKQLFKLVDFIKTVKEETGLIIDFNSDYDIIEAFTIESLLETLEAYINIYVYCKTGFTSKYNNKCFLDKDVFSYLTSL